MRAFITTFSFMLSLALIYSCGTESTPTYTLTTSVEGEGTIMCPDAMIGVKGVVDGVEYEVVGRRL